MDATTLSLTVGALATVVLPLILQAHWSSQTKAVVVGLAAVCGGLAVAYFEGQLVLPHDARDGAVIFADIAVVYAASQAVYAGLKQTGLLGALESATTLNRLSRGAKPGRKAAK